MPVRTGQTKARGRPRPTGPTRANLGFELAKASQRWNELLAAGFGEHGFPEVRPAFGSVLLPLFEEDGLRMGEIAARARLSKQTITSLVRRVEAAGLVRRADDPADARASRVELTARGRDFAPVAREVVAALERQVARHLGAAQTTALREALRDVGGL
jgi:DNA-binding MarR family transcriptional regulator